MGNDNFTAAPSGVFKTQDGTINIAANKQEQWEAIADELGVAELKTDPRFQKRDTRKKNRKELTPLLEAKLMQMPTSHWVEVLNKKGVPSGEILSMQEALAQPQIKHRETIATVNAEGVGELKLFNLTAKFEKTPGAVTCPPPRLGAHTVEILQEMGFSEEHVKSLKAKGVV
jgi:formyl-CoA transferase